MDRISSLPDGVISHILSFLSIKEAASTSLLSTRWRILFAFSPNLHFLDCEGDNLQSFTDFVDRVLSVSGHSPIKTFTLTVQKFYQPHINRWICDLLRRGILELELQGDMRLIYGGDLRAENSLSFETFTCKTLVKLNLCAFFIHVLPEDSFLPALKTLVLKYVKLDSPHVCGFQKLLSACPVLEDLTIQALLWEERKWPRLISSLSLQRLTIWHILIMSDFEGITFDTPNLTYLDYGGRVPHSFPIVNLDSLVEARLNLLVKQVDNEPIGNPTNLIKGLRNVKIMELSHHCMEMFYIFREAIPMFQNLVHLSVESQPESERCWQALPFLLQKALKLETLIIKGPLTHDHSGYGSSGYSCLLSCPVKVLKITFYSGTTAEVELLKHFVGKLSCLELLEVKIWKREDKDKFQIAKDLRMLPRASSKCKINVI